MIKRCCFTWVQQQTVHYLIAIAQVLAMFMPIAMQVTMHSYSKLRLKVGLNLSAFNAGDKESKFKVVIFDASGIGHQSNLMVI